MAATPEAQPFDEDIGLAAARLVDLRLEAPQPVAAAAAEHRPGSYEHRFAAYETAERQAGITPPVDGAAEAWALLEYTACDLRP